MRISDWSSDVCSSDLGGGVLRDPGHAPECVVLVPDHVVYVLGQRQDAVDRLSQHVIGHGGNPVSGGVGHDLHGRRSEEHTSELQSLMRISYAVFCLKKKNNTPTTLNNYLTTQSLITSSY